MYSKVFISHFVLILSFISMIPSMQCQYSPGPNYEEGVLGRGYKSLNNPHVGGVKITVRTFNFNTYVGSLENNLTGVC